ncbi:parkin co-regulated protein-domain-containing protein [Tribonema minus]|uniref:Parkin co-regulated protein-domain-containing protein n=1 Tax=Tribonema minus TaxID=303371 RepID=A0A836C8N9_9STRA|nr:parkin co-regulated protein-domain-containing protein [Tribonema minus]
MPTTEYVNRHIRRDRREEALLKGIKPKGVDSCFGNFPITYKHGDHWDGNPTLRRGMRKRYSSSSSSSSALVKSRLPTLSATAPIPEEKADLAELQATRQYLMTSGKFKTSPAKLMAALEVARATHTRPLTAPGYVLRRRQADVTAPKAGAWRRRAIAPTLFRRYYERGDLPICVDHRSNGNAIRWKMRAAELDFHVYLPIFFDGLREVEDPFRFLAVQGTLDMVEAAPDKVLPVIPQLILPLKSALNTRAPTIICPVLKILQQMILLNAAVGQALVPYYRQILPIFNLFKAKNANLGDGIDYGQRSRVNVGELILETLELMEQFGGPDAFINIKYLIPTYESCCA